MVTIDGITGFKPAIDAKFLTPLQQTKYVQIAMTLGKMYENPARARQTQLQQEVTKFFIPFRGDESSKEKVELICKYINDPSISWNTIASAIEER